MYILYRSSKKAGGCSSGNYFYIKKIPHKGGRTILLLWGKKGVFFNDYK